MVKLVCDVMIKKLYKIYKNYEEIINYLIVGFLTTVLSLSIYYISVLTILDPNISIQLQIANILSWIGGVIFAYVTNRKVVFKSVDKNVKKEASKFLGARLLTLFFDMLFMFLTVTLFKFNDKIMKIISNIIVIVLNYLFSKMFVFLKKSFK